MAELSEVIERAWERRQELAPGRVDREISDAVEESIAGLDAGTLRVAEKRGGEWIVNAWLKKAVLLYFRTSENRVAADGVTKYLRQSAGEVREL